MEISTMDGIIGSIEDIFECQGVKCYILKEDNDDLGRVGYIEVEPETALFGADIEEIDVRLVDMIHPNVVTMYDEFRRDITDLIGFRPDLNDTIPTSDDLYDQYLSQKTNRILDSTKHHKSDEYQPKPYAEIVNDELFKFGEVPMFNDEMCRYLGFRILPITHITNLQQRKQNEQNLIRTTLEDVIINLKQFL